MGFLNHATHILNEIGHHFPLTAVLPNLPTQTAAKTGKKSTNQFASCLVNEKRFALETLFNLPEDLPVATDNVIQLKAA